MHTIRQLSYLSECFCCCNQIHNTVVCEAGKCASVLFHDQKNLSDRQEYHDLDSDTYQICIRISDADPVYSVMKRQPYGRKRQENRRCA